MGSDLAAFIYLMALFIKALKAATLTVAFKGSGENMHHLKAARKPDSRRVN